MRAEKESVMGVLTKSKPPDETSSNQESCDAIYEPQALHRSVRVHGRDAGSTIGWITDSRTGTDVLSLGLVEPSFYAGAADSMLS